jgi:hypothetical protein
VLTDRQLAPRNPGEKQDMTRRSVTADSGKDGRIRVAGKRGVLAGLRKHPVFRSIEAILTQLDELPWFSRLEQVQNTLPILRPGWYGHSPWRGGYAERLGPFEHVHASGLQHRNSRLPWTKANKVNGSSHANDAWIGFRSRLQEYQLAFARGLRRHNDLTERTHSKASSLRV